MDGDVSVVETGGRTDFFYGGRSSCVPAKVDRILHDGDEVRLGGTVLVALTPGHTRGCTTYSMKIADQGRSYNVVIVGSPNVLSGYRLIGDPRYPQMAADFERTFRTLRALPCDIFLGSHASMFGLDAKYARRVEGGPNPFIDPQGYVRFVDEREQAYQQALARQAAKRP